MSPSDDVGPVAGAPAQEVERADAAWRWVVREDVIKKLLPALAVIAYAGALLWTPDGLTILALVCAVCILVLFYGGSFARVVRPYCLPLVLTGALYDTARLWPHWAIHVSDPYELEKALFGIATSNGVVTPNEWFATHTHAALDVLTGLAYLVFVAVYVAFAAYFVWRLRAASRERDAVAWAFLVLNVIGYTIWFFYPAAPPWYVELHGLDAQLHGASASAAGCLRFDALVGIPIFGTLYANSTNVFGAIPSLHVGYSVLSVYFALRYRIARIVTIVFAAMLAFSAVYLNHHYIIDAMAGALCAGVAGPLSVWLVHRFNGAPASADQPSARKLS